MRVDASHVERFHEDGYVVVEGLLDPEEDLGPVVEEYSRLIDAVAERWLGNGSPSDRRGRGSVTDRLLDLVLATDGECFQELDISLPLDADIEDNTPMHCGPAVFGLLRNSRLLDAVEEFIGPEIYCNPVQHVRVKPPERDVSADKKGHTLMSTTFWHQDLAVISDEADDSNVISVWLPMVEATDANGCLVVVPGSHRLGLVNHCRTANLNGIPDGLIGMERRPLPMKPGDVLFFHKLTRHASLANESDHLRWSFDLRYNPIGEPTGRPWFPGFVARSRARPESELHDSEAWAALWHDARDALAPHERPEFNRWDPNDPLCA
jgi:phytanoyl-CoA hydroxylase